MTKVWVVMVVVLMSLVVPVAPVRSQTPPNCNLTRQLGCLGPNPPSPAPNTPQTPPSSPYYYTYQYAIGPCPNDANGNPTTYYIVEVRLRSTGAIVNSSFRCIGPDTPAPPLPPPPPTPGQVVIALEDLLRLDTGINPPPNGFGGLTQLDTWLWCDNDGDVDLSLAVGGWNVSATARITQLRWTIDGPGGQVERTATNCGSQPSIRSNGEVAAARWKPTRKGSYTIQLAAQWGGTFTRTLGGASETLDLGTAVIEEDPIAYRVREIQTVGERG